MDKEQKKRLKKIRPVENESGIFFTQDDGILMQNMIDEQAAENQRLTEIIQKLKTDACVCSETEKCIYCIEIEAALEQKDD